MARRTPTPGILSTALTLLARASWRMLRRRLPSGLLFFARLAMLMPERDRQRHTYVLGKSGSGKSELLKLLVYGYLRKPGSATVVVIDPHGDLAEEIARFKEHRRATG